MTQLERLIAEEGEKVVNRDLDLNDRETLAYVDLISPDETTGRWTIPFWYRYCTGEIKTPFRKERYLDDADIPDTIEALGLDVEKFWWVILFVYDYVDSLFTNAIINKSVSLNRATKILFDSLGEDFKDEDIEIIIKKKRRNVEVYPAVKKGILDYLRTTYDERCRGRGDMYYSSSSGADETISFTNASYRIYETARMYRDLFSVLLPDKGQKPTDRNVSLNKLLLISRICYLYKFTHNENFLYSDESLKGIMKSYKGRIPQIQSPCYL